MERWNNRVALVTGANSGIGCAIAKLLVKNGLKVIGADVNKENMELAAAELKGERGSLTPYKCDLRKNDQIDELFAFIVKEFGGIDVCVNNAGLLGKNTILGGSVPEWRAVLDVNVMAVCQCSQLAANLMLKNKVDDGHIINIASIHTACYIPIPEMHFYRATKFAVKAITEGIRYELMEAKSRIKITTVNPGATRTSILENAGYDTQQKEIFHPDVAILPEDMANSILYCLATPANVQVQDILVSRSGTYR